MLREFTASLRSQDSRREIFNIHGFLNLNLEDPWIYRRESLRSMICMRFLAKRNQCLYHALCYIHHTFITGLESSQMFGKIGQPKKLEFMEAL